MGQRFFHYLNLLLTKHCSKKIPVQRLINIFIQPKYHLIDLDCLYLMILIMEQLIKDSIDERYRESYDEEW